MIDLFLVEPTFNDEQDVGSAKSRISLLSKLESVLWKLLTSGGRSEVRLWLSNTIASVTSISPQHQRDLFMALLRRKPLKWAFASQLLQMLFEKRSREAGILIAKRSYIMENFFEGNPRRISQWFSNFATNGASDHGKGAKALAQFAFVNRDICWEELEWKGKHGQSPAVVATKPHYFLDLDVHQTVKNFIENVPEFWSSIEFAESLKDGEILFLDTKFFAKYFVDLMLKDDPKDVWEVIDEFLMHESFSSLCQHLLVTLEEADFCNFLKMLCELLRPRIETKDFGNSSFMFEVILSKYGDSESIDQILLLNAVINQGRQLLRLLRDEDGEEQLDEIKAIVHKISVISSNTHSLFPLLKECDGRKKTIEMIKWLGLQSWVLHYRMSEECQTPELWESLFVDNGIGFQKSNEYSLLDHSCLSEDDGLEPCNRAQAKYKKRKKGGKGRKRRKRNFDNEDSCDDELLDFDIKNDRMDLKLNTGSWLLSTDEYAVTWNAKDLPEHLSKHCMASWMKWLFAKRE
ncbi:unnamed protein product [Citrullus colocynthis]|uniref:Uncharacterized protein n=1 Tax=Citrullus colocynthis TaxID=252529 RepID=A0ABP0YLS2_9ROSI